MLKLEQAVQRCFDRCNLIGESVDIWQEMYKYKAIRMQPEIVQEEIYADISTGLFGPMSF